MTDKDNLAAMDDRTVPMPTAPEHVGSHPPSAAADADATQNREPQILEPPREGSAVYAAPEQVSDASFDAEVEQQRAPAARPAVGYTTSLSVATAAPSFEGPARPRPISTGPSPAEVFASKSSFVGGDTRPTMAPEPEPTASLPRVALPPPSRPREPMPVGLPFPAASPQPPAPSETSAGPDDPTAAAAPYPAAEAPVATDEHFEVIITAPMALGTLTALRAQAVRTEPLGIIAHRTTTEEEPPPLPATAEAPPGAATAEAPPAPPAEAPSEEPRDAPPDAPGTPTLELPASNVPFDDQTLHQGAVPPAPRRSMAVPLAVAALLIIGVAGGLAVRSHFSHRTTPAPSTPPAVTAAASVQSTSTPDATTPTALPLPTPPVVAPSTPAPQPLAPTSAPKAVPTPVRAPDGFGPFVDRSGAAVVGLARALGDGIRAALGDALAGTEIGVRGELRRTRAKDGVGTAECAMVVFDAQGPRATVRGAARIESAGGAAALLPRAAEACARAVETELRAAVAHAKGAP